MGRSCAIKYRIPAFAGMSGCGCASPNFPLTPARCGGAALATSAGFSAGACARESGGGNERVTAKLICARTQWRFNAASPLQGRLPGSALMSAVAEPITHATPTTISPAATPWCWRWRRRSPAATTPSSSRPPPSSARCWRPTRAWRRCRSPAMVHRHVGRHAAHWRSGAPLRPALRAADRLGLRRSVRADLLHAR